MQHGAANSPSRSGLASRARNALRSFAALLFQHIFKLAHGCLGQDFAPGLGGPDDAGFGAGGGIDRRRLDDVPMHHELNIDFGLRLFAQAARDSLCASHTMLRATISASIISSVWAGDGVSLRRSGPRGTVG